MGTGICSGKVGGGGVINIWVQRSTKTFQINGFTMKRENEVEMKMR